MTADAPTRDDHATANAPDPQPQPEPTDDGAVVRETYEEYEVGETKMAMIADPWNEHAWIQSDATIPNEL